MTNGSPWKYFNLKEVENLEPEFVSKLDKARHESGIPFVITSGYRSPGDNEAVGGVSDSSHTKGRAVDLRSQDAHSHYLIVKGAILAGICRIGIYYDGDGKACHIHLDDSTELPQEVMWHGISH